MTASPFDLPALRWHLWEQKVVGTVESPRGTEYYVAMTSSPESATRIVEVHNALLARAEVSEKKVAAVRELASPDWCPSVPASAKQAILARIGSTA